MPDKMKNKNIWSREIPTAVGAAVIVLFAFFSMTVVAGILLANNWEFLAYGGYCFNREPVPGPPPNPKREKYGSKTDWQRYENSRYGFSLSYPSGWKLGEAPTNNDGRSFSSPDGKIECRAYGFANALPGASGDSQTLEEFAAWATDQPGVKVIQMKDAAMAGRRAKEILTGEDGKAIQSVYILGSESGRALNCIFENLKQWEIFRENFEVMKKSFELNASLDG